MHDQMRLVHLFGLTALENSYLSTVFSKELEGSQSLSAVAPKATGIITEYHRSSGTTSLSQADILFGPSADGNQSLSHLWPYRTGTRVHTGNEPLSQKQEQDEQAGSNDYSRSISRGLGGAQAEHGSCPDNLVRTTDQMIHLDKHCLPALPSTEAMENDWRDRPGSPPWWKPHYEQGDDPSLPEIQTILGSWFLTRDRTGSGKIQPHDSGLVSSLSTAAPAIIQDRLHRHRHNKTAWMLLQPI